jgi:hypothetical protein
MLPLAPEAGGDGVKGDDVKGDGPVGDCTQGDSPRVVETGEKTGGGAEKRVLGCCARCRIAGKGLDTLGHSLDVDV